MFEDEVSGLYQQSNTVEPTTYAKVNSDLTASQSQHIDALAAHTTPLGSGEGLTSQVPLGNLLPVKVTFTVALVFK